MERRGEIYLHLNITSQSILKAYPSKRMEKCEDWRIFRGQKLGVHILCESTNSVGLNVREDEAKERN